MQSSAPLKPDRKSQDPAYVRHPVVLVAGGIQPDLLHELQQGIAGNDGFTPRMLFAFPACTTAPAWTEAEVAEATVTEVEELYQILRSTQVSDTPSRVTLTPAAKALWVKWYEENGTVLSSSHGVSRSAQVKRALHVARFALILHAIAHPEAPDAAQVSVDTMAGAIELDEYFAAHFRLVLHALAQSVTSTPNASGLFGRVYRLLRGAQVNGVRPPTFPTDCIATRRPKTTAMLWRRLSTRTSPSTAGWGMDPPPPPKIWRTMNTKERTKDADPESEPSTEPGFSFLRFVVQPWRPTTRGSSHDHPYAASRRRVCSRPRRRSLG